MHWTGFASRRPWCWMNGGSHGLATRVVIWSSLGSLGFGDDGDLDADEEENEEENLAKDVCRPRELQHTNPAPSPEVF
jgi:hypothetical protein